MKNRIHCPDCGKIIPQWIPGHVCSKLAAGLTFSTDQREDWLEIRLVCGECRRWAGYNLYRPDMQTRHSTWPHHVATEVVCRLAVDGCRHIDDERIVATMAEALRKAAEPVPANRKPMPLP